MTKLPIDPRLPVDSKNLTVRLYELFRSIAYAINGLSDEVDALPTITVGTSAPASPATGDLWVDTN